MPCTTSPRSDQSIPVQLTEYTVISSPDMAEDKQRKLRLEVSRIAERIRREERQLDKLHIQMDKDLEAAQQLEGPSINDYVQARYEADYRNANGLPVKQLDTGGAVTDLETAVNLIKSRCQNKINQQKQLLNRLYREYERAERRLTF